MKKVRTRFAPSPTGYMHIGNLRTALYGYLYAMKEGGDFILRLEDTDSKRYVDGAVQIIYDTLKDAGIRYAEGPDVGGDFGPYIQSERGAIYRAYAEKLVELGGAYYCFCDKERIDSLKDENGIGRYDKHCLHLSRKKYGKNSPQACLTSSARTFPRAARAVIPTSCTAKFRWISRISRTACY